jgi:hypothetical protein
VKLGEFVDFVARVIADIDDLAGEVECRNGHHAFAAIPGIDLGEILCIQEERRVGNGNCVSFNRLKLQIPASPLRAHFVKATVKVRQYHDGTHAIFPGR